MKERKRTVEEKKRAAIEDVETFAKRIGEVEFLKPHCDLLLGWANEAKVGAKEVDDILEFINGYRKRLRNIMGGLLTEFESLEGEDLAQVIVSLFPPQEKSKAPNIVSTWKPRQQKPPNKATDLESINNQNAFWD